MCLLCYQTGGLPTILVLIFYFDIILDLQEVIKRGQSSSVFLVPHVP